jgi:hypothetical protein
MRIYHRRILTPASPLGVQFSAPPAPSEVSSTACGASHRGHRGGDAYAVGALRTCGEAEHSAREERRRELESHSGHLREKARCCFDGGGMRFARRFADESVLRSDTRACRIV